MNVLVQLIVVFAIAGLIWWAFIELASAFKLPVQLVTVGKVVPRRSHALPQCDVGSNATLGPAVSRL